MIRFLWCNAVWKNIKIKEMKVFFKEKVGETGKAIYSQELIVFHATIVDNYTDVNEVLLCNVVFFRTNVRIRIAWSSLFPYSIFIFFPLLLLLHGFSFYYYYYFFLKIACVVLIGSPSSSSSPVILKTSCTISKSSKTASPNKNDWCENEFRILPT